MIRLRERRHVSSRCAFVRRCAGLAGAMVDASPEGGGVLRFSAAEFPAKDQVPSIVKEGAAWRRR